MLAGPSPKEEITVLRDVFKKPRIVAIDTDAARARKALEAGADASYCDSLEELIAGFALDIGLRDALIERAIHEQRDDFIVLEAVERFDLVDLDLTCQVETARELLRDIVNNVVRHDGFVTVTFSYGMKEHGVERFLALARGGDIQYPDPDPSVMNGLSPEALGRAYYLVKDLPVRLRSVIGYKSSMPMCSVLCEKVNTPADLGWVGNLEQIGDEASIEEDAAWLRARVLRDRKRTRDNEEGVLTEHGKIVRNPNVPGSQWKGLITYSGGKKKWVPLKTTDIQTAAAKLAELKIAAGIRSRAARKAVATKARAKLEQCPSST